MSSYDSIFLCHLADIYFAMDVGAKELRCSLLIACSKMTESVKW